MSKEEFIIEGKIEQRYRWSAGLAGSVFFRELKNNGRIMGTKCKKCNRVLVPPRIFCERCFERLDEWEIVSNQGTLNSYSIAYIGRDAKPLEKPDIIALIDLDGTCGGFFHILGEIDDLKKLKIGMRVEAVFKDKKERTGSILDISYFRPI